MKADEDVKMISAEAPVLFAKACEMFIIELTHRSYYHTIENKRKTLQRSDIAQTIASTDIYDFLQDIIPKEELREAQDNNKKLQEENNQKLAMTGAITGAHSDTPQSAAPHQDIMASCLNTENTPQEKPLEIGTMMADSSMKTENGGMSEQRSQNKLGETDPSHLNQNDI